VKSPNPYGSAAWSAPPKPSSEAVRDLMLERATGMRAITRKKLFSQPWWKFWAHDIPPALYFDSAETPPTFFGLERAPDASGIDRLRCHVGDLVADEHAVAAIEAALRTEAPPTT
jgi:hypothetical protein